MGPAKFENRSFRTKTILSTCYRKTRPRVVSKRRGYETQKEKRPVSYYSRGDYKKTTPDGRGKKKKKLLLSRRLPVIKTYRRRVIIIKKYDGDERCAHDEGYPRRSRLYYKSIGHFFFLSLLTTGFPLCSDSPARNFAGNSEHTEILHTVKSITPLPPIRSLLREQRRRVVLVVFFFFYVAQW